MQLNRMTVHLSRDARVKIRSAEAVHRLLWPYFLELKREHLWRVDLDARDNLLGAELVSIGTVDSAPAQAREIFGPAFLSGASRVWLAHNHPTGILDPSPQDVALDQRLSLAGSILGVDLVDHVIMHDDRFISMRETAKCLSKRM